MMDPRWQLAAATIVLIVCIVALISYSDVAINAVADPGHSSSGVWVRLIAIIVTGAASIFAALGAYKALGKSGRRPGR